MSMSLRKKHSKNSQTKPERIICDTKELKTLITNWMENEGWNFENFADFLELVGVSTPVKLSNLTKQDCSFSCISKNNKEFFIRIRFGSFFDFDSEIHITSGEYTYTYTINQNFSKGDTKPSVALQGKTVKKKDKELIGFYSSNYISNRLTIANKYLLDISITNHSISEFKNLNLLEDYLITLDRYMVASVVCKKIIKLLGFSFDDVSKCDKISVLLSEKNGTKTIVRSKVVFSFGVLQEYATTENNETFEVSKNGFWSYHSNNISIEAPVNANRTIQIKDSETNPYKGNLTETLIRITATINSLKLLFKEN